MMSDGIGIGGKWCQSKQSNSCVITRKELQFKNIKNMFFRIQEIDVHFVDSRQLDDSAGMVISRNLTLPIYVYSFLFIFIVLGSIFPPLVAFLFINYPNLIPSFIGNREWFHDFTNPGNQTVYIDELYFDQILKWHSFYNYSSITNLSDLIKLNLHLAKLACFVVAQRMIQRSNAPVY